jgi:hypothetical protein
VVAADPQVLRLFEIAGLDGAIRVERSLDDVMAELLDRAAGE